MDIAVFVFSAVFNRHALVSGPRSRSRSSRYAHGGQSKFASQSRCCFSFYLDEKWKGAALTFLWLCSGSVYRSTGGFPLVRNLCDLD